MVPIPQESFSASIGDWVKSWDSHDGIRALAAGMAEYHR